jgi:hypothetical protein
VAKQQQQIESQRRALREQLALTQAQAQAQQKLTQQLQEERMRARQQTTQVGPPTIDFAIHVNSCTGASCGLMMYVPPD